MRPREKLVQARTRVSARYALMPLEGFPVSRLPTWPDAQVKVLASPALGAQFVQYLIELSAKSTWGHFEADERIETFFYVLSGGGWATHGSKWQFRPGDYSLTPP